MPDVFRTDLAKIEVQRSFAGDLKFYVWVVRVKLTFHPVCLGSQTGDQLLEVSVVWVQSEDDESSALVTNEQRIWPIHIRDGARYARDATQRASQETHRVCAL